ncbi:iron-sulfur cluster carrier protein [Bacteroidia bacterium]|nr:iron-sulfur cluster carrier protein [Bacteroidia bacterium]
MIHPEKNQDIVSLGLIENLIVSDDTIAFTLHFQMPRDPFANALKRQCEQVLKAQFASHTINITLQFAEIQQVVPPSTQDTLSGIKRIIAVMSGKGGVGKSTVAVNLAVTLAQRGYKVGLVDADIYGPSLPKMFGVESERPTATDSDLIAPVEKYGVKMLSIGFFVKPADALIWRAPMVISALKQLLLQAQWGELDFLFIDMPPGTGDIHLTLVNEVKLAGAIIVGTPQQVALADVVKSISLLQHENVNVKILGLVENMAWFTPAELPQNRYYIFGKGGTKKLADAMHLPLLAEIPLVQALCESGDAGAPLVLQEGIVKNAFEQLADKLQ